MNVVSSGIPLHAVEKGAGDIAVVFLHYYGGSSCNWKHVTTMLAPTLRTITIDHRGWGQSDEPDEDNGLSDLVADAEGVIASLNLQRYVLVSHSIGGKVAQLIASSQPSGLAGLILVAPSPPSPMIMPAEAREMMAGAYASRETVEAATDIMLTVKSLSAKDRAQVPEDSLRGAPEAMVAWPRSTNLEDIALQVGGINVPTLVIAGELDRVGPPVRLRAELLTRIPQAVMHVLPGSGHLSMVESPDAVSALIAEFCGNLRHSVG